MPRPTTDELIVMLKAEATRQSLDPALMCAIAEQESNWEIYATRYEDAFYNRYLKKLYPGKPTTESIQRAISFGVLQLMGQSAREIGYSAIGLATLLEPIINFRFGCMHFANKLKSAKGDVEKALLLWNGGSAPNYGKEVLARKGKYSEVK